MNPDEIKSIFTTFDKNLYRIGSEKANLSSSSTIDPAQIGSGQFTGEADTGTYSLKGTGNLKGISGIIFRRTDPVTLAADPGSATSYNYINMTIPGGTIGTSNMVRARIYIDGLKSDGTQLIGFASTQSPPIGGGGPGDAIVIPAIQVTGPSAGGYIDVIIIAQGTTSSQAMLLDAHLSDQGANSAALKQSYKTASSTTGAADSRQDILFVISLAWAVGAAADNSVTMRAAYVEVLS